MIERNIRFAIAKKTLNGGQPSKFYTDLADNPGLFVEIDRSDATVLYAIRSGTLEKCSERK